MTSILGVLPHLKLQEVRRDQPSQIEAFLKLDILSTRASFALFFPVGYSRLLGISCRANEFVSESCCQKERVAARYAANLYQCYPWMICIALTCSSWRLCVRHIFCIAKKVSLFQNPGRGRSFSSSFLATSIFCAWTLFLLEEEKTVTMVLEGTWQEFLLAAKVYCPTWSKRRILLQAMSTICLRVSLCSRLSFQRQTAHNCWQSHRFVGFEL